jgi:hypothetical protein
MLSRWPTWNSARSGLLPIVVHPAMAGTSGGVGGALALAHGRLGECDGRLPGGRHHGGGVPGLGWRWCAPYLLVSSAVALVLLIAPDSYTAFGLIFLALVAGLMVGYRSQLTT